MPMRQRLDVDDDVGDAGEAGFESLLDQEGSVA